MVLGEKFNYPDFPQIITSKSLTRKNRNHNQAEKPLLLPNTTETEFADKGYKFQLKLGSKSQQKQMNSRFN